MEGVWEIGQYLRDRSIDFYLIAFSISLLLIIYPLCFLVMVNANPDTETLRPIGVGTTNQLTPVGATYNWQCVDEETSNEDTDYVRSNSQTWKTDTYSTQDHSIGSGTISKVTIYIRCKSSDTFGLAATARTAISAYFCSSNLGVG